MFPGSLRTFCMLALPLLALSAAQTIFAQDAQTEIGKRLIGRPLYLRDAWLDDKLEFDERGRPVAAAEAHRGPVTLSGIDVKSVKLRGNKLEVDGLRVALISPHAGEPLQRATSIGSTTLIVPSLRKHIYRATENVRFILHADAKGSFDAALHALFADGLAQLASSVPGFWRCYANNYFVEGAPSPDAAANVRHCAGAQSKGIHFDRLEEDGFHSPEQLTSAASRYTSAAGQLGLEGASEVYVTVEPDGSPSEFQVIQPLGAGLDEETLRAISLTTFRPATLNGTPVRAGYLFSIQYGLRR